MLRLQLAFAVLALALQRGELIAVVRRVELPRLFLYVRGQQAVNVGVVIDREDAHMLHGKPRLAQMR